MKDEFPEVFKKELEVGKWYSVERTRFYDPKKALILYDEKDSLCGFDHSGKYTNYYGNPKNDGYIITEATPQEVETALINEAKKRGFLQNLKTVVCLYGFDKEEYQEYYSDKTGTFYYEKSTDKLWIQDGSYLAICVFENGKWATIIETITIQEAEKLLNKKIVGQ